MSPYIAVLKARFRLLLQYRAAALAGFATQLFWGLIRVMIFRAFYLSSTGAQPMTYDQTITYLWLIQGMLVLLPWHADSDIQAMIRDGTVAYEMVRPTDLYWFWFSRSVAARTAPLVLRMVPLCLLAGLFFGLQLPASPGAALAFLASLVGAVLVAAAITTLMTISLMWTLSGDGLARLLATTASLLSGSYIPLPFFPDWAQGVLNWLPFRAIMDVPFRLYSGHLPAAQAPLLIGQQLLWAAILVLIGRLVLSRGLRRLVVQGG
jgi:ABC-2 type transport system permease protein